MRRASSFAGQSVQEDILAAALHGCPATSTASGESMAWASRSAPLPSMLQAVATVPAAAAAEVAAAAEPAAGFDALATQQQPWSPQHAEADAHYAATSSEQQLHQWWWAAESGWHEPAPPPSPPQPQSEREGCLMRQVFQAQAEATTAQAQADCLRRALMEVGGC